jgi:hypothetical protein
MKEALSSSETSVLTRGATSQKTPFFIVTAVKSSNLTTIKLVLNLRDSWKCARLRSSGAPNIFLDGKYALVGLQSSTLEVIKNTAFCDITPFSPMNAN